MITFTALDTAFVRRARAAGRDANGQSPERHISDGTGNPCRHCLRGIHRGADMLVLAHRPFPAPQPHAEVGPIFPCADDCARGGGMDLPAILTTSTEYLIKGYTADHRIKYGTGAIVPKEQLRDHAQQVLSDDRVAYLHVRSARNNCYLLRIDRV